MYLDFDLLNFICPHCLWFLALLLDFRVCYYKKKYKKDGTYILHSH